MIKLSKNFQPGIQVTFSTNLDSAKFEHWGHRWPPFVAVKLIRRKRGRSSSRRRRRSRERNAEGEASAISREKEWGSGEEGVVSDWDGHFFFFFYRKERLCLRGEWSSYLRLNPPSIFSPVFILINDTWQENDHTVKKREQVNKLANLRDGIIFSFSFFFFEKWNLLIY